ncbi:DUF2520 domain-containing protein [Sphingosinicella sp.]|uniref:Rossmann-like and DUF2520 domain-containing protein n=1 Tax=Sphingosinicella sp. TaxID=1917971 RepID=UPI0026042F69|nr:DUF2520 domain-containing protein [Sphingosinicella sp.]
MIAGQVGIVGTGRVARALALGFGGRSMMWGRTPGRLQAEGVSVARSLEEIAAQCDVIGIAVSDDALPQVVDVLAGVRFRQGALVFHVSGGSGAAVLEPLRLLGVRTAAIHPVMTFTGNPELEVQRMAGACFAITGSDGEATRQSRRVVEALGGVAMEIAEDRRTLYHAALSHAANHLVTLFAGATRALHAAGVEHPETLVAPLVRASLENSIAKGFDALSGPLLRGDANMIRGHLAALADDCPEVLPAYRALARATIDELERCGKAAAPSPLRAVVEDQR